MHEDIKEINITLPPSVAELKSWIEQTYSAYKQQLDFSGPCSVTAQWVVHDLGLRAEHFTPQLKELLTQSEPEILVVALEALGCPDNCNISDLMELAKHENPILCRMALEGLCVAKDLESYPGINRFFQSHLADSPAEERRDLLRMLYKYRTGEFEALHKQYLNDDDPDVAWEASRALGLEE